MIITISRQAATNGALVAQLVAERLGCPVYDRELVDEIARRMQVDPNVVMHFDEHTPGAVESLLWEWRSSINEDTYRRLLQDALGTIAQQGCSVIVGRGANFMLRRPDSLHARVIAPMELRIAMYMAGNEASERDAKRYIQEQDQMRAQFVKRYFHRDIESPEGYDLVVNLEGLTPEMAADLIAQASKMRQSAHFAAGPKATMPQYVEILARHRKRPRPGMVERRAS